eukprot:TCONS_00021000-protein
MQWISNSFPTFFIVLVIVVDVSIAKSPIILIPGTGGNRLEAKLTGKKWKPAWYCLSSTITFYTLWFDLTAPFPGFTKCWADNIRLEWDLEKMTTSDVQGVETKVPEFGRTESVEYLDSVGVIPYMKSLVEYFVTMGYERNKEIRAAPYDFRYSPDTTPHNYFNELKDLTEETYVLNNNEAVTLITHSYGGLMTLYFLNKVSKSWKKKFIKQWIALAAPFGGSILETLVYASGFVDKKLERVIEPLDVRAGQRSFTSNLVLLPSRFAWSDDYVFAQISNKTFTISNISGFLDQVGFHEGTLMMEQIVNNTELMKMSPGVPISCFYGNKLNSTVNRLIFDKSGFPDHPIGFEYGHGDGSVNLESLVLCEMFADLQKENVTIHELPDVGHLDILENEELFSTIESMVI